MRGSFYGWYFKCQSETQTLAIIPAVHQNGGERSCSIQIITDDDAWLVEFKSEAFRKKKRIIAINENIFGERGIKISLCRKGLSVCGKLKFSNITPLKYDIMGPFSIIPFMQCRHNVYSISHLVNGKIQINGREFVFVNSLGYWEGDSGCSFPKEYLWTQCCFSKGSIMLSVADIPMAGLHFKGIIGVVYWKGKEYRLATYLGAKVIKIKNKAVCIAQGDYVLEAKLIEEKGHALKAPANGNMNRVIHESASCKARYRLRKQEKIIFDFVTDRASFEYEYPY